MHAIWGPDQELLSRSPLLKAEHAVTALTYFSMGGVGHSLVKESEKKDTIISLRIS